MANGIEQQLLGLDDFSSRPGPGLPPTVGIEVGVWRSHNDDIGGTSAECAPQDAAQSSRMICGCNQYDSVIAVSPRPGGQDFALFFTAGCGSGNLCDVINAQHLELPG